MAAITAAVDAFWKRVERRKLNVMVAAENAKRYTRTRVASELGRIFPT